MTLLPPTTRAALAAASLICLSTVTAQKPATVLPEETTVNQLPATALGPEIPAEIGYLVEEIVDGLYYVSDGLYNAMFLVSSEGVIAVDAPPTLGANHLSAIRSVTDKPITHLVYTHAHTDHIGGAGRFPAGVTIVAHEETAANLARRADPRRPIPTVTFADSLTIRSGEQELRLRYEGNNHMAGNLFAYAPRQRTLMLVDVIFPGWVPFKNLGIAEDVPGYIAAHDFALAYPFETLVAGHVTRLGTRADVETSRKFVHDLHGACAAAFGAIDFAASVAETGSADKWQMYDTYFNKVVDHATAVMRERWADRLGGLDTYLRDDV